MRLFRIIPFCAFVLLLACSTVAAAADALDSVATSDSLNTDDGPHVLWQNDSTVVLFYFCDGAIESRTEIVTDTLRFSGFCKDTATSYTIIQNRKLSAQSEFDSVLSVFAISDIHGDYDHLIEILINSKVIDSALVWRFGSGHLVIDGDLFDRGEQVTECLWLLYRLEQEAEAEGGKVHVLLGNHELMVLQGDLRYVHEKYTAGISSRRRFPYDELFSNETELGRWLRSKNAIERLGDLLFVHGGLHPDVITRELDINKMNETAHVGLRLSRSQLQFQPDIKWLYGSKGPFWYRGFHYEMEDRYPAITESQVDSLLSFYNANQVIVGHTQKDSITVMHSGKVIAIDIVVEDLGGQQALYYESGVFYRVSKDGSRVQIKQ